MLISLNWINELLNIDNINLDELIEKLTLGGFEVEDTFEVVIGEKTETVLEISATANRADSISTKGIAKEIGSLINRVPFSNIYQINSFEPEIILQKSFLNSQILENQNCSTFVTITAENLKNATSPKWLKQKLISSGIEPENNLLDFQNYILLETGYPFEFYDLNKIKAKLSNSELNLKLATVDTPTTLPTINGLEYTLNQNTLVLKTENLLLGVAGVIPNQDFGYDETTTSILIEGSIFNSKKIRQTSRNLGLRTERSARYEKGLNNYSFNESICRLLNLLRINNPNINYKINSSGQIAEKAVKVITLTYQNVIEILGPIKSSQNETSIYITIKQISSYLQRLDFSFEFNELTSKWEVEIPNSRIDDITREIDLIEEIGRLHGFNNFVSCLPNIQKIGLEDFSYQTRKKLTTCFLSEGLNELMQYSLVKEPTNSETSLKLINPLSSDCSTLRISLLPNILETIQENLKQGTRNIEGFEFGHIFLPDSEKEYVGGNFGGIKTKLTWSENAAQLSWFEAKGKLEDIFKKLNIGIYWKKQIPKAYETILHPYRTTQFDLLNGKSLGVFGQVHPILAKQLNISPEIYLFEFDFEILKNELKNNLLPLYQDYSSYPKIVKDLSFIVDQKVSFDKIKKLILEKGTDVLIQLDLLDEYQGESIPTNCTSLCIQLTFQSTKKTLRTEEVEIIVNSIQSILVKEYNIIQRV